MHNAANTTKRLLTAAELDALAPHFVGLFLWSGVTHPCRNSGTKTMRSQFWNAAYDEKKINFIAPSEFSGTYHATGGNS